MKVPSLETRRLTWAVQDKNPQLGPQCAKIREGEATPVDVSQVLPALLALGGSPAVAAAVQELTTACANYGAEQARAEGRKGREPVAPTRTPKTIRFVMRIDAATADNLAALARAHRCTMSDAARQAIAEAAAVAAALRRA